MALIIKSVPVRQTVLQAIAEVRAGRKDPLTIVKRSTGEVYEVRGFDDKTQRIRLIDRNNLELNPIWSAREEKLYEPVFR